MSEYVDIRLKRAELLEVVQAVYRSGASGYDTEILHSAYIKLLSQYRGPCMHGRLMSDACERCHAE